MISISLVSHAQMPLVHRLLESIAGVVGRDFPLEFILTENRDRSGVSIEGMPGMTIRTIVNPNPYGLAKNHNQAFQNAKGDYYCVINPDVIFTEDVFPILIDQISSNNADVVAPLVFDSSDILQDSFRDLPTPSDLIRRRLGVERSLAPPITPGELVRPDWIAGIVLLMKASTYNLIGGFDERYHLYFEDVDFSCRARLAGLSLAVVSDCSVIHEARRASHSNLRPFIWHTISAIRFFSSSVYWRARSLDKMT
jgi:GT2 family glycosyltransferase